MTLWPLLDGRAPESAVAIDGGAQVITTAQLRQRAQAVAATLREAGVGVGAGAGDCVAVWLPNWPDALAWQFGASAVGAHVIGINTRYNVGEVR
ncbi:MAG TPA: AMP-binding protein, partial [Trebonia sp.]